MCIIRLTNENLKLSTSIVNLAQVTALICGLQGQVMFKLSLENLEDAPIQNFVVSIKYTSSDASSLGQGLRLPLRKKLYYWQ